MTNIHSKTPHASDAIGIGDAAALAPELRRRREVVSLLEDRYAGPHIGGVRRSTIAAITGCVLSAVAIGATAPLPALAAMCVGATLGVAVNFGALIIARRLKLMARRRRTARSLETVGAATLTIAGVVAAFALAGVGGAGVLALCAAAIILAAQLEPAEDPEAALVESQISDVRAELADAEVEFRTRLGEIRRAFETEIAGLEEEAGVTSTATSPKGEAPLAAE